MLIHVSRYRVEGAHAKLKKLLKHSQGDFNQCWDSMHDLIELQQNNIQRSFEQSVIIKGHRHNMKLFSKIRGVVSTTCLDLIHEQWERSKKVGTDKGACRCVVQTTHGIPCACRVAY